MPIPDVYSEKYVVFLDLLGFKAKVNAADVDSELRKEVLTVLRIVRETLCNNERIGMQLTHFSDCIIFSANRTAEGLWEILQSINMLSVNLLNYDFFVRGGLTVGGIHHDQDFVYGAAVNEAYLIESKEAKFPLTLVSDEVLADAKKYGSQFVDQLTQDSEGRYFVHYLSSYAQYTLFPIYSGKVILDYSARRIVDFICHRLNTDTNQRVLEKDIWFQNYWNEKVAALGILSRIESGVTERDLGHGPTILMRRIVGPAG